MGYTIYCIKNKINGKIYIGYTSKNMDKRFNTHIKNAKKKINRRLYDSMNYHGYDKFEITKLEECDNHNKAKDLESKYIYVFDSNNPDKGYNMTLGGDGGNTLVSWSDDDKKLLYKNQQKKREETFIERYGVTHHAKLDWIKEKISNSNKGKILSKDHKEKISIVIKDKIKSGEIVPGTANLRPHKKGEFKHSNSSKEKISKARLGKKYEDIFDEETINKLKDIHRNSFSGKNNPLYVENLNIQEQKDFINFLIENKTISFCEEHFKKSAYKLRQLLREYGIDNLQKLKNNDKENNLLKNILKKTHGKEISVN
jgi:group I intron endonuclease